MSVVVTAGAGYRLELGEHSCDAERSFAVLRTHARNHNLWLSAVAESVISGSVAASELDTAPDARP